MALYDELIILVDYSKSQHERSEDSVVVVVVVVAAAAAAVDAAVDADPGSLANES